MKKITLAIALAIASLGAAQAQDQTAAPEGKVSFLIGAGLTFGGDKMATAAYENGDEIDIHAGSIFALTTGIDYRISQKFSLQGTIGFHVDDATASNGDMRFQRFPVELLAYYHVSPQWRIGGGARYVSNAKLSSSGAADFGDYEFKSTVSGVLEAEYLMSPNMGFKVRLVNDKFEEKISRAKYDGKHIGLFANYYF